MSARPTWSRASRDAVIYHARRPSHLVGLMALMLMLACQRPAPKPLPPPPQVSRPAPPAQEVSPPRQPPLVSPRRQPPPVKTWEGPLMIRVGLATDLDRIDFPCCQPGIRVGDKIDLSSSFRVEPAIAKRQAATYRLQVAALKNEEQAEGVRERLERETGRPSEVVFDAGTDLYRVRWGRFKERGEAEAARGELERLGIASSWVVSQGLPLEHPALRLIQEGKAWTVEGRWLELSAPQDVGINTPVGRFRGKILVFLNQRGQLNLINELPIEAYLRGVVPKEMGPELYNELEALKAQTVAARTYTVRNLGEFAEEGYDICSTPRCQVYGGMAIEHSVSDRAIIETEGQVVLYAGEPAETFYSATCGGHTENVEVVFPLKRGPYLRGTPCVEAGVSQLRGLRASRQATFPAALTQSLLPPSAGDATRSLAARLEHLALKAGLPIPKDQLRSLDRGEVLRYVASVFDMKMDRRLLDAALISPALLEDPPEDWRSADLRLVKRFYDAGLFGGVEDRQLAAVEIETLLFELGVYLGWIEHHPASFLSLDSDRLRVRQDEKTIAYTLAEDLEVFQASDTGLVSGVLMVMPGDRLDLYATHGRLRAVVQSQIGHEVRFGRRAPKQRWDLFRTDQQLRRAVQTRYPGFPFSDFQVLERGVSGRVGRLKLLGQDGSDLIVEGLAIRWTLDIPDTSFQAQRQKHAKKGAGWRFRGQGWGHGVGMCQAGAFGMAMRGHGYRHILEHYYSGVELGRIKQIPERPRPYAVAR